MSGPDMNPLDLWKHFEELTVEQFVCLLFGLMPGTLKFDDNLNPIGWPDGADLVYKLLVVDMEKEVLDFQFDNPHHDPSNYEFNEELYGELLHTMPQPANPWWKEAKLSQRALKAWLAEKGIPSNFFDAVVDRSDSKSATQPVYLNSELAEYSPKLAAAVKVWEHFYLDQKNILPGKSLKQQMEKWLRDNAHNFKGKLSNQAIEEIAKIANWDTKGGAPTQ